MKLVLWLVAQYVLNTNLETDSDLQKKFQTEHKNLFSSEKHTNFLPGHKTTMLKLFNSSHKYHKRKVKSVLLFIELNEACNVEI